MNPEKISPMERVERAIKAGGCYARQDPGAAPPDSQCHKYLLCQRCRNCRLHCKCAPIELESKRTESKRTQPTLFEMGTKSTGYAE